jgi:hypothetical protein
MDDPFFAGVGTASFRGIRGCCRRLRTGIFVAAEPMGALAGFASVDAFGEPMGALAGFDFARSPAPSAGRDSDSSSFDRSGNRQPKGTHQASRVH